VCSVDKITLLEVSTWTSVYVTTDKASIMAEMFAIVSVFETYKVVAVTSEVILSYLI
jgi:hypothetical protein